MMPQPDSHMSSNHPTHAPDARRKALAILNQVAQNRLTLDAILERMLGADSGLSRNDRAFANMLVFGVLRWQGKMDWIIGHFSKTPLKKINPGVLNILRLGIYQILYLTRVPISAAVNTSVELAKHSSPVWIVQYVNGLLRNVARHHENIPFPDPEKNRCVALTVSKSFPKWLIEKWLLRFGPEETESICDAVNTIPPITVRTNTLVVTRQKLKEAIENTAETASITAFSPLGIRMVRPAMPIPELPAFQKGWFQVQDEAAQLVTLLLNPKPGETVLDACAGLGGKTAHMAQVMQNNGRIMALDHSQSKLNRLEKEMKRLGASIVNPIHHDLNAPLSPGQTGMFDGILLDAPCSGLGVVRRNPDIKWRASKEKILGCQQKQLLFLHHLAPLVKPGGRMVYTVCSIEPEENEHVVKAFLQQQPGFGLERHHEGFPETAASLLDDTGCLRTFPHLHDTDGFFSACLRRSQ
jgi:16S rRNA (cytosine967-C5)-methyltransferase